MLKNSGPLAKSIAQQSSEWLEASYPVIYDALGKELQDGRSLSDIRRILRRIFGNELREALAARILQAAEFMSSEMISTKDR